MEAEAFRNKKEREREEIKRIYRYPYIKSSKMALNMGLVESFWIAFLGIVSRFKSL
jgi:hypothetical protein